MSSAPSPAVRFEIPRSLRVAIPSVSFEKPIRVLHLVNSLGRGGGIEQWLYSLLQVMPRQVCSMDFVCKGPRVGRLGPRVEELGARVCHCPLTPAHVGFMRGLSKILRTGGYDIVHNHLNAFAGPGIAVARRLGIPTITTFHAANLDPEDPGMTAPGLYHLRKLYGALSTGYAVRRSDLVTGVSRAVLDAHVIPRIGDNDRTAVLRLGVNIPEPVTLEQRAAFRNRMGWTEQTPVLLHVGSFKPAKNHKGLVRIFARIIEDIPDAKLLLVGRDTDSQVLADIVSREGIAGSVRVLGIREDVRELAGLCDLFLFPSISEGFGLAPLEANAAGLAVVGSDIPGLREAVVNNETGVLHNPDDCEGLARSAVTLLRDCEAAEAMGRAGRRRAEESFSIAHSAESLLGLYQQVVRRPHVQCSQ